MSGLIKIIEIPISRPSLEAVPDDPPTLEAIGTALKGRPGNDSTVPGPPGPGLPPAGTPGQLPAKAGPEDYEVEWVDPPTRESLGAEEAGAAAALEDRLGSAAFEDSSAFEQAGAVAALAGQVADDLAEKVDNDDPRLSDIRTPHDHAGSHGEGGGDPIEITQSQVTGLVEALAGKEPAGAAAALADSLGTAAFAAAGDFEPAGSVASLAVDTANALAGKVDNGDSRLSDARDWSAPTVTEALALAGVNTERRAWTVQRVWQAAGAWWAASAFATKLSGIATGATANASDAALRDRSTHTGTQAQSTIAGLSTTLAAKADLVDGVIPTAQIPAIALTEYLGTVANQAAMLALRGQPGDWCVRTDSRTKWVIVGGNGAILADWLDLPTGFDAVSTVNGQTGTVTLSTTEIAEGGNLYFTTARAIAAVTWSTLTGIPAWISSSVAFGQSLTAAVNAAAARTLLGLGTAATQAATAFAPADQGVTNGNSHDHNGGDGAQIAYSSLSGTPPLGTAALRNVGTTAGTVSAGDDQRYGVSATVLTPVIEPLSLTDYRASISLSANTRIYRVTIAPGMGSGIFYLSLNDLPADPAWPTIEVRVLATVVPPSFSIVGNGGIVVTFVPGLTLLDKPLEAGKITSIIISKQTSGRVSVAVGPPETAS